jgi:DNA-directed RNA polymerase subunit F
MKSNPIKKLYPEFVKQYRSFMAPVKKDIRSKIAHLKPRDIDKIVRDIFKRHNVRVKFKESVLSVAETSLKMGLKKK